MMQKLAGISLAYLIERFSRKSKEFINTMDISSSSPRAVSSPLALSFYSSFNVNRIIAHLYTIKYTFKYIFCNSTIKTQLYKVQLITSLMNNLPIIIINFYQLANIINPFPLDTSSYNFQGRHSKTLFLALITPI